MTAPASGAPSRASWARLQGSAGPCRPWAGDPCVRSRFRKRFGRLRRSWPFTPPAAADSFRPRPALSFAFHCLLAAPQAVGTPNWGSCAALPLPPAPWSMRKAGGHQPRRRSCSHSRRTWPSAWDGQTWTTLTSTTSTAPSSEPGLALPGRFGAPRPPLPQMTHPAAAQPAHTSRCCRGFHCPAFSSPLLTPHLTHLPSNWPAPQLPLHHARRDCGQPAAARAGRRPAGRRGRQRHPLAAAGAARCVGRCVR